MKKIFLIAVSLLVAACSKPPQTVVFNEIAWMGTDNSPEHEWIELHNTTGQDIDLTGWSIKNLDTSINVTLSGVIPAQGYFLLETQENAVPEVTANQIYAVLLKDEGEELALLDAAKKPVDLLNRWHGGDRVARATLERQDVVAAGTKASAWGTASLAYSAGLGTPGAVNSVYGEHLVSDPLCDYPDQLEITAINIGQGDATLVATKTRLLLADAGESYWNSHRDADKIAAEIQSRYGELCRTLDYVVISHIHTDHIGYVQPEEDAGGKLLNEFGQAYTEGDNLLNPRFRSGFAYLVGELGFRVGQTIVRDYKTHNANKSPEQGGSKGYRNWRAMFESPNGNALFNPVTAVLGDEQIDLGSVNGKRVTADIVLVDGATPSHPDGCPVSYFGGNYPMRGDRTGDPVPPSENDYSIGLVINYGDFNFYVAGDQSGENYESQWGYRYHDTETCLIEDPVFRNRYVGKLDVLRANHHGSSHSTNERFVSELAPTVTLFSVGDHNDFGHVDPQVLEHALTHSNEVVMTEIGADVLSQADLCSVALGKCARVADDEFPLELESDEIGDPGVYLSIRHGGFGYEVATHAGALPVVYESK